MKSKASVYVYLFQEGIRYGMYCMIRKTEVSMKKISENQDIGSNRIQLAYVSGFGFGLVSGAFAITNVLSDSVSIMVRSFFITRLLLPSQAIVGQKLVTKYIIFIQFQAGPGTLGLKGGSEFFFVSSAAMALCIILLNTFWSVIFYSGMEEKNFLKISWVIASHFVVSSLSLLNTKQIYAATILPSYLILIVTILLAFRSAGGTTKSFIQSFTPRN